MEHRDPILLIAQTCFPHLLSLDDLLAARCVCKAWRQSLSTAFCNTWRLPYSIWHTAASCPQLAEAAAAAAAACHHAPTLRLDSGGTRPHLPPTTWPPLMKKLTPWVRAGGPGVARNMDLHLRNPPSPAQLQALRGLPWLHGMHFQHTHSAVYSRHLTSIAALTQLQELALLMEMPKLELRSLAHQRLRRVPLKADCLSSLVGLSRLEISCKAYTGDLLPDTLVTLCSPAVLAALSGLTHLSISELALPGPWTIEQWLQPLRDLQGLQLVMQDDPALCSARSVAAAGSSSTCSAGTGGAAAAGSAAGLLGSNGLSAALAAAAQAAGSSRADQQLAVAQQNLLAGLQNLSSALQQAASSGAFRTGALGGLGAANSSGGGSGSHHMHHHHHHTHNSAQHQLSPAGPSASSSAGGAGTSAGGAAAAAVGSGSGSAGGIGSSTLTRTSSSTSTNDADGHSSHDTAALPGAPAPVVSRPLLPISFSSCCPCLKTLVLANLYGERLVKMSLPGGVTRLVLHLANPSPGAVNGEQLAAVVLQAADSLLSLELGLGMRFSLSGAVMRSLKRSLKQLQELTLIEGAQDHLEGLGCWCNLPRLSLVEGRCTVPLRGLYELSMRAAMGRTPGVLSYHGHTRHVEELASRLGSALQELRLDSLTGLGSGYRSGAGALSSSSGSGSISGDSTPGSPRGRGRNSHAEAADADSDSGSVAEQETSPLPALAQLTCMTRLEVAGSHIGQLEASGVLVLSNCKRLRVLVIAGCEPWLAADRGVKEQLEWLAELPQLRQLTLQGVMLGRSKLSAAPGATAAAAAVAAAAAKEGRLGSSSDGGAAASTNSGGGGATRKPANNSSSSGGGGGGAGAAAPAVKGLGNGLGFGASSSKSPAAAAAAAVAKPADVPATPAAAAAAAAASDGSDDAEVLQPDEDDWAMARALMGSATALAQQRMRKLEPRKASAALPSPQACAAAQLDESVALCSEELRRWLCEMLPNCRVWLD